VNVSVRLRACAPMVIALGLGTLTLRLAPPGALLPQWLPVALAVLALAWPVLRPANVTRDDTLPALAVLLSAIGLSVVARLNPDLAHKQIVWLAFSLVLAVAAGPAFERFRVLAAYKYIWILCAIGLFVALALFGQEVNGAKLWIRLGPVQFEPVEVIKLLIVLFMASYLNDTADVIARTRPWSLRANAKYLGPLFLGWGVSMGILVFEHDVGMAALMLATFVAMLYVATRRVDLVAGATVVFGLAAWLAARTTLTSSAVSPSGKIRSTIRWEPDTKPYSRCSRWPTADCSAPGTGKAGRTTSRRSRPIISMPRSARSGAQSDRSCCSWSTWPSCCALCTLRSASRICTRNC
jgi:hypothetical protein